MSSPSVPQTISKGCAVAVHYRLEMDGGVTVEMTKDPVWYVQGDVGFPPKIQTALLGKGKGEVVSVRLAPEDAVGARDERLVMKLPRVQFKQAEPLNLGERLEGARGGQTTPCTVVALDENSVTVDFNPELAGVPLTAIVKVEAVASTLPK